MAEPFLTMQLFAAALSAMFGSLLATPLAERIDQCPHRLAVWLGGLVPAGAFLAWGLWRDPSPLAAVPALFVGGGGFLGAGLLAHRSPAVTAGGAALGAALGAFAFARL